jgi:hypothetical protein
MKRVEIRQLDEWVGINGRMDKYKTRLIKQLDGRHRQTSRQAEVIVMICPKGFFFPLLHAALY